MLIFLLGCGSSSVWTETRAETVRDVRGYHLRNVDCNPLKRGFACSGVVGANPARVVLVTYVLRPRDAGYYLTKVRFRAFGVP